MEEFEEKGETDFNYALGIYAVSVSMHIISKDNIAIAARLIASKIPTIEQLGMPQCTL